MIYKTFTEAYKKLLFDIFYYPEYITSPRNMKIKEIMNYSFTIKNPNVNLYLNPIRSSQIEYIAKELIWYFAGDRTTDYIGKHASLWNKLAIDGKINSNYGHLIFYRLHENNNYTQWRWAKESLINDKDSRQAILHFNGIEHQFNNVKDFPCTLYGIFHIRDNKLNFSIYMRSSDIIFGIPTDYVFFNIIHQMMLLELKETYPKLEMGIYNHTSNSLHLYEKHFNLVSNMISKNFIPGYTPKIDINIFEDFTDEYDRKCNMLIKEMSTLIHSVYYNKEFKSNNIFLQWLYDYSK